LGFAVLLLFAVVFRFAVVLAFAVVFFAAVFFAVALDLGLAALFLAAGLAALAIVHYLLLNVGLSRTIEDHLTPWERCRTVSLSEILA